MIIVIDSSRIMQCQQCIFETEDNDNISNILKNVGEGLSNHYDNLVLKETMQHSSILPSNTVKKRL